jgi:hypothetical protein
LSSTTSNWRPHLIALTNQELLNSSTGLSRHFHRIERLQGAHRVHHVVEATDRDGLGLNR